MAIDRVESSQSPEIALLWPLQDMSPPSMSDPAKIAVAIPWRPPVKRRKPKPGDSPTGRNRTSTARSSAASSSNSSMTSQDPLYAHLRPRPQADATADGAADELERQSRAIPQPSPSQTSSKPLSQGEPYYFPDNLSDVVLSNTPITFEKAFSQQMKEKRVGSTSSSSRTMTQIPIGGFSTLNATGMIMSRQANVSLMDLDAEVQPAADSGLPRPSTQGVVQASQRQVLAGADLNSPVKRAAASKNSGLPTPPFSDLKRPRQSESEDEDLTAELKDLKKTSAKYGILTPPSSTGNSNARRQGARAETVDPFSAVYDGIEVESMSGDENQTTQAGRPMTHPKAREARTQTLNKLKKSRVGSAVPASTSPKKKKRCHERPSDVERVTSGMQSDVEMDLGSGITLSPSLKRRKRARIVPSSQPDDGDDFRSIRTEDTRKRSVTPEHFQSTSDSLAAVLNAGEEIRGSQLDPDFVDDQDLRNAAEDEAETNESPAADKESVSSTASAAQISDVGDSGGEAESSPERPVIKKRHRKPLLLSSQASISDGDKVAETDADMPSHEDRSSETDEDTESPDVDLSTMFDDDMEQAKPGARSKVSVKVKSEKSRGKQPDYDMTVMSDEEDGLASARHNRFDGNNFVDLTEDDVEGDAYEEDKYERTQEPAEDDDDQGSSVDDFEAFDWDPSQPVVQPAPSVDAARPSRVSMGGPTATADGEGLVHPLRTISSLPEKLQHFYLTHWCRESTRKKGLVGTEAQLANDKLVLEEMEAGSAKRSGRGKTWASTVASRSGRGGAATSARGGRGAARGKAFFIQRAMRAKRAGRGRGRG